LRGKSPPIGKENQEEKGRKSPGEPQKKDLRGKSPPTGKENQEEKGRKSPGDLKKWNIRGIFNI